MPRISSKLLLVGILFLATFFRFYDVNWDQNQHLHPDERFLTMVGIDMKLPHSFLQYLDPVASTFNPANIGHQFYVYGTLPVIMNKLFAIISGGDAYNEYTILGRMLSAFVDVLVVLFIFKTLALLEERYKLLPNTKYWGAFFYAVAVLPIQLSHFFATDTFLNAFLFFSFYFALRFCFTKKISWVILSAIFFGCAIASKVTAVFITPLLFYFFIMAYSNHWRILAKDIQRIIVHLLLFGVIAYIVGRIGDPYLFQTGNFLDPRISTLFLDNLKQLTSWSKPDAWFPPGVQWLHKTPILFGLTNLVLFGVGVGYTSCIGLGIYYLITKLRNNTFIAIFVWVLLFFLYQSLQTTQTMRYFLILYPFLAMLAGIGFTYFSQRANRLAQTILLIFVLIWPLLFFSIYTKPHSRVTASEWIFKTIPPHSVILTESWDDALPLSLGELSSQTYLIKEMPVFDPDTQQKWQTMDGLLNQGDYLILSSNRGWGSIPTVPERYPQMKKFYADLFADKTAYKQIAEFTSYPSLSYLGIPLTLSDDRAEEAFTVYDHPKVIIFKHIR
jgi:Dolichyl-phosphate-mannose-protein mannosyltransferase